MKIAISITLLITGLALFCFRPNEKSILEAAHPVAIVDSKFLFKHESLTDTFRDTTNRKFGYIRGYPNFAHYLWQNNESVLTFQDSQAGLQCLTTKLGATDDRSSTVALPGLSLTEHPFPQSISSDGETLYWHEQYGSWIVPNLRTIAGGNSEKRPLPKESDYCLSPDSKSLVYAAQKVNGFAIVALDIENSKQTILCTVETELETGAMSQMVFSSPDRLILTGHKKNESDYLSVFDCNLKNPSQPAKISTIQIPENERVCFSLLSPIGDKMLVETSIASKPILIERLINNLSTRFFAREDKDKRRWYIYDLHGNKSEIGCLDYCLTTNSSSRILGEPGIHVGGIKWKPDGKNISFLFEGKLYLLPVKY